MNRDKYPDWFSATEAKSNFEKYLDHYNSLPNRKFLQLGAYLGDASVWLMENILVDTSSVLYDVDTWEGSDEPAHDVMDFNQVYKYYLKRTKKYPNLKHFKTTTYEYLRFDNNTYDFVYVDADHTAVSVLLDAVLAWDLLKPGGIMAFDDYEWRSGKGGEFDPAPGINTFLTRYQGKFKVIHKGWQIWIVKE